MGRDECMKLKSKTIKYFCKDLGEVTLSPNCEPFEEATCGQHTRLYSKEECNEMNKTDKLVVLNTNKHP